MTRRFHIGRGDRQLRWSRDVPPVVTVDPGQQVTFDMCECTGGQLNESSTEADVAKLKFELCDPIFGPVYVNGAEPGDVLEVEFLKLEPGSWGFSALMPGLGLLSDEFSETAFKVFSIKPGDKHLVFKDGIRIPVRPMLGVAGISPGDPGDFSTIPPLDTGGNLDCRHLTEGVKLLLPVKVAGALFSCGDGHAVQGDGEVCGTGVECDMKATLRFAVHKNMRHITSPHYDTSGCSRQESKDDIGSYATIGIDTDIREASRKAVRAMIEHLVATKGLTRVEAYMLASVAGDLKFVEVVDMPNYAIASSLPLNVFVASE